MSEKIFLSYSKIDFEQVARLDSALRAAGFSVWYDERNLRPGQTWELEIARGLRNAKIVLVCFSSRALQKRGYFHKEIRLALDLMSEIPEGEVFVIPVRLEDCEPPSGLQTLQWADGWSPRGLESLAASISACLALSPGDAELATQKMLREYFQRLPGRGLDDRIRKLERVSALWTRVASVEAEMGELFLGLLRDIRADEGFLAFEDTQEFLRIVVAQGNYWHLPTAAGVSGRAFATENTQVVDASAFRESGWVVTSELATPIHVRSSVVGIVLLDRHKPPAFQQTDLAIAEEFAGQIARLVS